MAKQLYEVPNGILAAARECGYEQSVLRQVTGSRALRLIDRVLEAFTRRGKLNRSLVWIWEDLREPSVAVHSPRDLETLLTLSAPDTRVWLLVEDDGGRKRGAPFWVFDATLRAAVGTLRNHHLIEFTICSREFEWLVAENHHNMLMGVGEHAVRTLRELAAAEPGVAADSGPELR